MTLDPKKLPPWMRKDKPKEPEKQEPPGDPVDMPPWLRDDFVPEPKVKRIAPQHPDEAGGDPPWLSDIPEVEEPKSYKIGGTELSAEYLAGGDELADTVDSGMTFDAWMAEQEESKRVKDIEEEIPDLFSDVEGFADDQPAVPEGKDTGQLPDWFLGLEALDTSDAPEWFVNEDIPDAQSKPSSDIPPWISDLVIEEDEPKQEAPPQEDDFGSLLKSIGRAAMDESVLQGEWAADAEEEEVEPITDDFFARLTNIAPEAAPPRPPSSVEAEDDVPSFEDLFAQLGTENAVPEAPAWQLPVDEPPTDEAPIDDFFARLGGAPPTDEPLSDNESVVEDFFAELGGAPASKPTAPQDDFADFDDFPDDDQPPSDSVDIPQNELDAFFDNVASDRSIPSLDDIAEPDLDWLVTSQPDDEPEEEPPPPPAPPATVDRDDTMSWLSELNNIVTSVTRPQQVEPEEPVVYDTGRLREFSGDETDARGDVDEYQWPEAPVAPDPEPEPEPEPDATEATWLDAITPDDLEQLDLPPAEAAPPPPPRRSLLSERLRKAEQPQPRRAIDIGDDEIFRLPSGDPDQDAMIPEDELNSGWLRDDLFTPAGAAEPDVPFEESEPEAPFAPDDPQYTQDDEDEIDFFSLLEANADANVLLRTGQLRQLEEARQKPPEDKPVDKPADKPDETLPDASLLDSLQIDFDALGKPGSAAEDDFYRAFGMGDDDDTPDKPGGVSDNHFYASFNTGGMDDSYRGEDDDPAADPIDDDFLASLGFDKETTDAWTAGQDAADDDDDFFAALGLNDTTALPDAEAPLPDWMQQADGGLSDEDLFAALGIAGDDSDDAQPAYASDEELYAALGIDDDAKPASAAPRAPRQPDQSDDPAFNAVLGMLDSQSAQSSEISDEELFAALGIDAEGEAALPEPPAEPDEAAVAEWANQQPEPETADDAFDAVLGMLDAQAAQPSEISDEELFAALGISEDDVSAQPAQAEAAVPAWSSQQSEPEAAPLEDEDIFAALGIDDFDADAQPAEAAQLAYDSDEDLLAALGLSGDVDEAPAEAEAAVPAWSSQQSEPEGDDEDIFAALGIDDFDVGAQPAEAAQPTYGSDEDLLAALGLGEGDVDEQAVEASLPQWTDQPEAAAVEDEDIFAALGMGDDEFEDQPAQPAYASDEELLAALGLDGGDTEDQPAEPAAVSGWSGGQDDARFADMDFETMFGSADLDDVPPAASEEDLLGQWAAQTDDELPQTEDFYAALGMSDDEAPPAASEEDVFGQWGTAQAETPDEDDFFAAARFDEQQPARAEAAPAEDDLFAEWTTEAELPPSDDFFSALGMIDEESAQPVASQPASSGWDAIEDPPEDEFFSALGMIDNKPPIEPSAPGFTDIDSYLASLPFDQPQVTPEAGAVFDQPVDFDLDAILSGSEFADAPATQRSPQDLAPGMTEDWLAQLQANVEEVSASAIVRQKEDRPVEELPSRLQRLRRLSEQIPDELPPDDALTEVLPGLPPTLAPAPFVGGTLGLVQEVTLTPEQQSKANLLQSLVPTDAAPQPFRMSAIEATYDSPYMSDLEDTPETILEPVKSKATRKQRARRPGEKRQRLRIDRLLVAVVLAAAMIVPFFIAGFRVGNLPPAEFAAGSPAQIVFDEMDSIPSGALVLVGVEYSPASAAELDAMTNALVRHIFLRAAYPVVVSGNPLGLMRAANLIESINDDADFLARIGATEPLQANADYFIVRYLPGSVIGLRAFSEDTANLLLSDIRGQASKLVVRSLDEFARVVVITDRAEDMRSYAEQIAPLTDAPLVAAVSYGAAPLAEPYARTHGGGLLVGLGDAYTYASTLGLATINSLAERIRIIPTDTPAPTQPPPATQLPATALASATPTIMPTPEPQTATVVSRQAVNMRSGPSTDKNVLAAVPSGASVLVLGFNADRSWVNVQIEDGRQGWISAALLEIRESGAPASKRNQIPPRRQDIDEGEDATSPARPTRPPSATPTASPTTLVAETLEATIPPTRTTAPPSTTPRPSRTPSPTATLEPTSEATAEATPEAIAPSGRETGYRDERWYAMNLGIIASALIITFGAVVNIARGLLRRGRRR